MTLAEVIGALKARGLHDGADDIAEVIDGLAEPSGHGAATDRRHPTAGGLRLLDADIANVVRIGLEEMIKAHRVVEGQRAGAVTPPAARR